MSVILYSTCSPILPGCTLTDGYGGFMPDGYYSNGVNWAIVSGGLGVITSYGSCTLPPTTTTTSTSTSTTTTAAPPPPGTVYILSDVGCSGITTLYVTGNINPVVNKYYKPTSVTGSVIFNGSTCFECIGTIIDTAVYTDLVFGSEFLDCSCVTTTTTVAPLTAYTLYYSSVSALDACTTTNSITVYSSCNPIIAECELWYDAAGTVIADEYFYSDHAIDTVYEMHGHHFFGTGVVALASSCITTTTTAPPYDVLIEFFGEVVSSSFNVTGYVVSGTVADNMTWDGLINTYTGLNCTGVPSAADVPFSLSFSIGNTAGYLTHDLAITSSSGISRSKIVVLDLLSPATSITSNNQDITIGGTIYRIQGYGLCNLI